MYELKGGIIYFIIYSFLFHNSKGSRVILSTEVSIIPANILYKASAHFIFGPNIFLSVIWKSRTYNTISIKELLHFLPTQLFNPTFVSF